MKISRSVRLITCFLSLAACVNAQDANRDMLRGKFVAEIEKIANSHDGVMGVAIKDLTTSEEILINDQLIFPTGSSIKIPILIELYKQAAEGKYKLTDQRWVEGKDKVGGSGVIVNFGDHTSQLSLGDLATLMIVLSDNTATNMLIDQVGMANVNRTMDELGLKQIRLRRKMIDQGSISKTEIHHKKHKGNTKNTKYLYCVFCVPFCVFCGYYSFFTTVPFCPICFNNSCTAVSSCRSRPARLSSGVFSTRMSGCTP
jgi:beta-lactamase class A